MGNLGDRRQYYPGHIELTLAPFSEATLAHFIEIESPRGSPVLPNDPRPKRREARDGPDSEVTPEPQAYESIGALYAGIETGIRELVDRYGEENVFIGPARAQALARHLPFPGFEPILHLDSALATIAQIVEEGEGTHGEREDAHYGRFREIERDYQRILENSPGFEPARPALTNPGTRRPSDANVIAVVQNHGTIEIMDLFNAGYGLMVQMLGRFFLRGDETDGDLETLLGVAIDLMAKVLTPLGEVLTRLPAGETATPTAGPSFEFHRAIQVLPHRVSAWRRFTERLNELASYAESLADGSPVTEALLLDAARSFRGLAGQTASYSR